MNDVEDECEKIHLYSSVRYLDDCMDFLENMGFKEVYKMRIDEIFRLADELGIEYYIGGSCFDY